MNVLHLPTSVGGMPWALAQGEKALGLDSRVLVAADNWLNYPANIKLHLERRRSRLTRKLVLFRAFLDVRSRFDVFHFNFGQSLFPLALKRFQHLDLPFYPRSARLFVTYNGCDARQRSATVKRHDRSVCHGDCGYDLCDPPSGEARKRAGIEKMARFVRHIWAVNPDLLYVLPPDKASFLPYAIPIDNTRVYPIDPGRRRLRLVHAPTVRATKGTPAVLAAVETINREQPGAIELVLVEGVPHQRALGIYASADLVVDQLLVGWYGGFAVEAMGLGKPVISYVEPGDLAFIPPRMASDLNEAMIFATPETLTDVLRRCLADRTWLARTADAAAEYARRWHDPRQVAEITKEWYEKT